MFGRFSKGFRMMDWRCRDEYTRHHCTHHRTRKLLRVVDCECDSGIAAVEDAECIRTGEAFWYFTGAFASRRKPEFYAEFENTGKDFCWLECWRGTAPDFDLIRGRA